jgi:ribosomal RNA methyltransferase Nop2
MIFPASIMKNTGVLFANDSNADRVKAVVGNFHRLGIVNSVITNLDARKFPAVSFSFYFSYSFNFCPILKLRYN